MQKQLEGLEQQLAQAYINQTGTAAYLYKLAQRIAAATEDCRSSKQVHTLHKPEK